MGRSNLARANKNFLVSKRSALTVNSGVLQLNDTSNGDWESVGTRTFLNSKLRACIARHCCNLSSSTIVERFVQDHVRPSLTRIGQHAVDGFVSNNSKLGEPQCIGVQGTLR